MVMIARVANVSHEVPFVRDKVVVVPSILVEYAAVL